MGGSSQSREAVAGTPVTPGAEAVVPLCTNDLRRFSNSIFDVNHDYERITKWYARLARLGGEGSGWEGALRRAVDYAGTGDSKVNKEDFKVMHQRLGNWLDRKEPSLDRHLPWVGQSTFGVALGFTMARMMKMAWRHKFKFVGLGLCAYNLQQLLEEPARTSEQMAMREQYEKMIEVPNSWFAKLDPGLPTRSDIALTLDWLRLGCINQKLGPGGIPEGPAGAVTVLGGLWWGLRCL